MSRPMYEFEGEFEDEFEYEGEFEFEGEGEFEYEFEGEGEYEFEMEGEYEGEEFFGRLVGLARRAAQNPALRQLGLRAARSALGGLSQRGGVLGAAANVAGGMLPQQEFEFEGEFEGEYEAFSNPQNRLQTEALMAHLGNAAASSESEDEAEAFIGSLIPLAARLIPQAASAVMRHAPALISGISNVARTVMNNPTTQQMLRTLPTVARNTAADIARQVAAGRPITTDTAVRALARQTANVLSSPQRAVQAYQRNRALDQRYHRTTGAPPAPGRAAAGGAVRRPVPTRRPPVIGGSPMSRPPAYRGAQAGAAAARRGPSAGARPGCPVCRC